MNEHPSSSEPIPSGSTQSGIFFGPNTEAVETSGEALAGTRNEELVGTPTGTLTFLLTDIEGSTRLWEAVPRQMRRAMLRHDALIEDAAAQHSGRVVKPRGEGDSRFLVFSRATGAAAAALLIQRRLADEPWDLPAPLRVRIGLHTGEVVLRDGEYYGTAVNRCARLRTAAHGGQTLLSHVTYRLIEDELPEGARVRDLGEHTLRGLTRPERIYQLAAAGLTEDFPPLQTLDLPPNNLPAPLSTFIGRERELAEVKQLVANRRLVTITGAGGMGKTRLALEAAPGLLDSFAHGAWFIDLAPLASPGLAAQQMVSVLVIREEEGFTPEQLLSSYLKDKSMLLILDNCEHLLPGIASLAEKLLREASRLKILATSRQPLGTPGEKVWWIPSLTVPDAFSEDLKPEQLLKYEAVRLFVERAQEASADFTLTRQNARAVVQVCAHLDGLPLAIELAGARVRLLTVEEIAARLDDRFELLVAERAALQRQQTLRALIDWSYDLLPERERILFRRLAVFSGGFDLTAASRVCSGGEIKPGEVLELLSHLIDKSFVIAGSVGGEKRYRFQETIHQYSLERLKESKELGEFTRRHALYYLQLAEQSFDELRGPRQEYWLPRLDADAGNLRAALDWMGRSGSRKELFLRMAGSLWRFWKIRGYTWEGRSRLAKAIEKYPDAPPAQMALALRGSGVLAVQQGDYAEAAAAHQKSLSLYREMGDDPGAARQLHLLGEIAQLQGRYSEAEALYRESLTIGQAAGVRRGIAETVAQLGIIARDQGQYPLAREHLEESLKLSREIEDKELVALALKSLGLVAYYSCEYPEAGRLFEEALDLVDELNDRPGISDAQLALANAAKDQGDFQRAVALYRKSLEIKQEYGDRRGVAQALAGLAETAFFQGKYPEAAGLAGQSLASFRELGVKRGVVLALGLLAFIACYQGDTERACSTADEFLALALEMNAPRPIAYCKEVYGLVAYARGELDAAEVYLQEAVEIFERVGDRRNVAILWTHIARLAYRQGEVDTAAHFLDESLALSRRLAIRWTVSFVLEIMGLLKRDRGDLAQAEALFKESLKISAEQENQQGIANCLGALAGLALLLKQPARAARAFAAAQKIRDQQGMAMGDGDRQEYERYSSALRDQLDPQEMDALWDQGYSLSLQEILEDFGNWLPASS